MGIQFYFCGAIFSRILKSGESSRSHDFHSRAGQISAPTHNRLGSGFVILTLLFKIGSEQLAILDGGQEEKNADKKVFHKKPGVKMIQNTGALQGRINTRGTEEQLVG